MSLCHARSVSFFPPALVWALPPAYPFQLRPWQSHPVTVPERTHVLQAGLLLCLTTARALLALGVHVEAEGILSSLAERCDEGRVAFALLAGMPPVNVSQQAVRCNRRGTGGQSELTGNKRQEFFLSSTARSGLWLVASQPPPPPHELSHDCRRHPQGDRSAARSLYEVGPFLKFTNGVLHR